LQSTKAIPRFLEVLGLDEEPMGIFYTDEKPAKGFSPKPMDLPTREKETNNDIDFHQTGDLVRPPPTGRLCDQ